MKRGVKRGGAGQLTVSALVRQLGVKREAEVAWAVGRAAADLWRHQHGRRPAVALVRKADGNGSHHMAVYPPTWRKTLLALVRLAVRAQDPRKPKARRGNPRQLPLFPERRAR